ncbi:MAG: tetratricopeptide repeat protein, partial [Planctomycetota bacterium]
MPQYTDRLLKPSAACPEIPFYHEFSCREREMKILLACLRRTLLSRDLSGEDHEILASLGGPGRDGEDHGSTPLLLIRGKSGMGKSRLIEEARSVARESGIRVKEIFCYERQGVPFLPILRLVKELILESPSEEQLWKKYSYVLSRVYPELASQLGEGEAWVELPAPDGKTQFFDALTGLLGELSRERPLLLVIHDLHRCDQGTVDFLEFLGRNAFLDDACQVRESRESAEGPARGDAAGDWKDVGLRNPRGRRYFSDGLPGDRALLDIDSQGRRLMVIANYRASCIVDTDADASRPREDRQSRVLDRLDALDREAFVCRIELAPLGLAEAGNLIHRTLGGRSFSRKNVARIHEATGGNPLYMLEILRALHEQGAIPPLGDSQAEPNREIEVPQHLLDELLSPPPEPESPGADPPGGEAAAEVKDPAPAGSTAEDPGKRLICRRLESLDEVPQRVVRALAVLRRPVQVSLLESLLGYARTRIDEALAELQGRDCVKIQPVETTPRFFLAHEDYVQCIYGELDSDERRDLHHRVGTILAGQERSGEPVRAYEIYEHLRQSSCPREALPFGLTSARYFANAYAEGLAAKIEKGLLGMLTSAEDLPLRLELLGELSRLETRIGELLIAKAHIKQLLEEGVDLDACTRLEAMLHLGDIYRRNGEPIKGIKTLHRAQKTCQEAVDGVRHARISGMLARMRLDRQDPKRAISLCMRGLKGLEGLGESEETETERAGLFEALAEAHLAKGEMVAAIHHYQGLLELVEEIRDDSRMATVLSVLGRVYYDRGNYFRAARYLFRALDVIRRTRDLRALSRAYDSLGKVYRNSGDHLRGLEYFNRSLRIRERIGDAEALSPTLNSLGSLYAHNGDYLQAIDYFKRSVQNSERFGSTAGIVRGFLHLGWVYFELGARKQVESLCKQILILSQEFHLIELEGEGHRLQGNLLLLRGDWKRAEREFRRAMEIASRRGRRKGEAAATLDLGALLYGKEEYEGALKLLSKGQVQAMEIQSIPLQVRAFLLKGNVYRFLKGGNSERAKECLRKGLDLISGARLLPLRWELEYSLAKVHQSNLEYL